MSREARVLRGLAGATIATLLASASHALAGGAITWLAVVATAVLALPLCVALAGRVGSLWRLSLAVASSQFLFHWSFAGLGVSTGDRVESLPLHAGHAALLFTPGTVGGAEAFDQAGITMWAGHLLAALVTIALLHRGEQAVVSLLRLVQRAIPLDRPRVLALPAVALRIPVREFAPLVGRLLGSGPITHRGPPVVS